MQLGEIDRPAPVLGRLRAAACLLLAAGAPAMAHAEGANPKWQIETSALLYGEKERAKVVEPIARVTRLFDDGQTVSAQIEYDVITGASPTGARPSSGLQTTTTPSGRVVSVGAGQLPLTSFHDRRLGIDADWSKPIGALAATTTAGHYSNERDYRSVGLSEKLSLDVMHRLATLTVGAGFNNDQVSPIGGTPVGLASGGTFTGASVNDKHIVSALAGVSRVLSRRWMMSVNYARSLESGYLTEPYKVVSMLDPVTKVTVDHITEKRPDRRERSSLMASSVYHLANDVLYASYRYYWDDWQLHSNTLDLKYRSELGDGKFLQPHLRLYHQKSASIFTAGLVNGAGLPAFASSDQRLSSFNSATLGLTCGFHAGGAPGEFTVRAEYIRQFGQLNFGQGGEEEGPPATPDLFPPLDIGTLTVGYTVSF